MEMQKYKVRTSKKGVDVDKDRFLRSYGVVTQYSRGDALKEAKIYGGKIVIGEKHERNTCPKCGDSNLDYYQEEAREDMMYFMYTCGKCNYEGVEVHKTVFIGHE